jgi:type III restriction enzyme
MESRSLGGKFTRMMEIRFDPNQQHQLDAIFAVDSVFDGQSSDSSYGLDQRSMSEVLATANSLVLDDSRLLANLNAVQEAFELPASKSIDVPLDLTVEMETGTGKTYVYLRTIQELRKARGLKKFVIVAPTVAIREGISKSYDLTLKHFADIYGPSLGNFRIYDSSQLSLVREFSISNDLETLLIGLDAFNKESNLIYTEAEELDYSRAIDLLAACRPVVILDEPQNMEGPAARKAIACLNPLVVLRYSATHRNVINPVYRLSPVDAYELGLVKRIDVLSVTDDTSTKASPIEILGIETKRATPRNLGRALIRSGPGGAGGPSMKRVKFGLNDDFVALSGGRDEYNGYRVSRVDVASSTVYFSNGVSLRAGQRQGTEAGEIQRLQVRATIQEHLERELLHRESDLQMKVLSVFFIDSVNRYVDEAGEIRKWFIQAYSEIASEERFQCLDLPPVGEVHRGYFAKRRGQAVDTQGNSKADRETYELIMRDKERLLDPALPVRFIFSHSALREGWDNPNVFQICTLNLTVSELKKRQEIGRGLRLPVKTDGTRCTDLDIARLTVIANESYDDFARALQHEFEEDCGVTFDGTTNRRDLEFLQLVGGWRKNKFFQMLWAAISEETSYRIALDTVSLLKTGQEALADMAGAGLSTALIWKAALDIGSRGVIPTVTSIGSELLPAQKGQWQIGSILSSLHAKTGLTRSILREMLLGSGRLDEIVADWTSVGDLVTNEIRRVLASTAVKGVVYSRLGRHRPIEIFEKPVRADLKKTVVVSKSIYDRIAWQSTVERDFALGLEARKDVHFFLKFPNTYKIDTLVGPHTPDWVIVQGQQGAEYSTVVVETKGDPDELQLRESERIKIRCAKAHFEALGVPYFVLDQIAQLPAPGANQ